MTWFELCEVLSQLGIRIIPTPGVYPAYHGDVVPTWSRGGHFEEGNVDDIIIHSIIGDEWVEVARVKLTEEVLRRWNDWHLNRCIKDLRYETIEVPGQSPTQGVLEFTLVAHEIGHNMLGKRDSIVDGACFNPLWSRRRDLYRRHGNWTSRRV